MALLTTAGTTAPAGAGSDASRPPVNGAAALARLGDRLPSVARALGLRPEDLAQTLRSDSTAWLDSGDGVFYAEPAAGASATAAPTETLPTAPAADVFALHSRPGASRVLYIDFTGHVTTGTAWNYTYGSTITSAPFDLDGSPSTFNSTEQDRIQKIWLRVAEDYAPWEVDVTTQDPGVDGLRSNGTGDASIGERVVVSPSNWYSTSAGGVAYIGSFGGTTDTPAFVFTAQLASGAEKATAEAIAHEAGHTLGLQHDGTSTASYYSGAGTWAPIMGVGYYEPTVQWSRGEYPGANNLEDDVAIIGGRLPARADDHGDTVAAATVLSNTFSVAGLIGSRSDIDRFSVAVGAGTLNVQLAPASPSANLDASLTVADSSGAVIASSNPAGTGSPSISVVVAAGTFTLAVDGVGEGDLTTGYSDYASSGRYVLSGSAAAGTPSPPPTPVAPVASIAVLPSATVTAGGSVSFDSSASNDPDGGQIVARSWSFTGATPVSDAAAATTRTFAVAGSYVASLTVTDDEGQTSSTSVNITVTSPPVVSTKFGVTAVRLVAGAARGTVLATVTVVDANGQPVAGAAVTGTWSGQAKGTVAVQTQSNGVATTPSASVRRSGTVTFTVTSVTPPAGSTLVWDGVQASAAGKF